MTTTTSSFSEADRMISETKRGLDMETITNNPLANLQSRLGIPPPTPADQGYGFQSLLYRAVEIREELDKRKPNPQSDTAEGPDSMRSEETLPDGQKVWASDAPRPRSRVRTRARKQNSRIKKVLGRKIHELWKMRLSPTFEDTWSEHATFLSDVPMSQFGIGTLVEIKPDMEPKQDPALEAQWEPEPSADADLEWEWGVESEFDLASHSDSESNAEEQTEDMIISKHVSPIEPSDDDSGRSTDVLLPGTAEPITIPCVENATPTLDRGGPSIEETIRLQIEAEVERNLKEADPLLNWAELTLLECPYEIYYLKYHHAVIPRESDRTFTSPRQGQMGKMIWRGRAGWCPPIGKSPLSRAWTPEEMKEDDERPTKPSLYQNDVCLGTKECMCWDCEDAIGF